jgi:alpha-1,2-mannosyltransferase
LFIFFSVLVPIVLVDSLIYKKLVIVPWNIVSYNVLNAKSDMGPEIFGTEPWTYYILNLLTNFNVLFPLAAISLLLSFGYRLVVMPLALWKFKQEKSEKKRPTITQYIDLREGSKVVSGTPLWLQTIFYLWLSIVIVQPHKEERFLYVIYPAICVNAAISLQICMSTFRPFARVCAASVLFTTILLSTLRSTALATYYRAPSSLYSHLEYEASPASICVGREWYRYQSSYFLQDNQRLKFIKSGFDGLLPGEFDESPHFGWDIPGAYRVPQGMNNRNQEDKGKYVDKDQCDYVVDISSPVNPAAGEVLYTSSDQWDKVYCAPFLDSNASSGIGRILWIPARLHGVFRTNLVWTEYCLLRRNSKPL